LSTQLTPTLIIVRSQIFSREKVLLGGNRGNEANRTTNYHARNSSPSACGSSLVDAGDPKTMLEVIVGVRQSLHIIAVKEPSSKVVSNVSKVVKSFT
jgi:hypothetical protein